MTVTPMLTVTAPAPMPAEATASVPTLSFALPATRSAPSASASGSNPDLGTRRDQRMRNCCGYAVALDTFGSTSMISSLDIHPER